MTQRCLYQHQLATATTLQHHQITTRVETKFSFHIQAKRRFHLHWQFNIFFLNSCSHKNLWLSGVSKWRSWEKPFSWDTAQHHWIFAAQCFEIVIVPPNFEDEADTWAW